jgi:medium-chain acyl-[acyl-carrier-protein] hydrolase
MIDISHKDLITTTTFRITSAETDMESRIRLGSLVNLLIQSAINSADNLGFGFGGLKKQKLFWVLSRLTVEIYRPLEWYETVEVDTWPKTIERILYIRDFEIRDKDQKVVSRATSGWLPIDIETKRPRKIDGLHEEMFVHLQDKHGLIESPEKLMAIDTGNEFEIHSSYYDIDLNRHVTAIRYIDWMMDTFPVDFHRNHYPGRLSVNYLKETMPQETLKIRRHDNTDMYRFEGENLSSHSLAFRGKINYS